MTLCELKEIIDKTIKTNPRSVDSDVIVTTNDYSVGARAGVGIKYAGLGLDWEKGQFRLIPFLNIKIVASEIDKDYKK